MMAVDLQGSLCEPPPPNKKTMPEIQLREALRQAMTEEMDRDPNVFLLGEEVAEYNGAYKVSEGMLARFGEHLLEVGDA